MLVVANKPPGTIKNQWDDFIVQEIQNGVAVPLISSTYITGTKSDYTYFWMTKRGVESGNAVSVIAKQLGVSKQQVTTAGLKDAYAHTSQVVVVAGEFIPQFNHSSMWLQQIGPASGPLYGGKHGNNQFLINVETDASVSPRMPDSFRNYFGPQRFGDGFNEVGRDLLLGHFERAAASLRHSQMNGSQLNHLLRQGFSAEAALLHPSMKNIVGFKVLQWQSWLWNQRAALVETSIANNSLRIPMWSLETADDYDQIWDPARVDVGMNQLGHHFSRPLFISVKERAFQRVQGGFQYKFQLPPGAYATVYLDAMYNINDVSRSRHN